MPHITRPALAYERVQTAAVGQVVLELKTPWRDGTTHLVMLPLEFIQRMAALVHRPRLHLIRFHGVQARATASGRQFTMANAGRGSSTIAQAPAATDSFIAVSGHPAARDCCAAFT